MKAIVINATALDNSGALTILRQFVSAIPADSYKYILFISDQITIFPPQENIKFIPKQVKSFPKRFYWDAFGLNRWLKRHQIEPILSLSLQNTNFRVDGNLPNFIYFHQSIPFFSRKWNPFSKRERQLWFYKEIYPFFIRLFINNRTEIFVQTNFVKEDFSKKFSFPKEKIHVIFPTVIIPSDNDVFSMHIDTSYFNIFYPATPFIYKNHEIIFEALRLLDKKHKKSVALYLTCDEKDIVVDLLNGLEDVNINFMGKVSFGKVLGMYQKSDLLLFPSYIETLGLPLLEAASFGIKIIVSDLPYAREVLDGYKGATFADYQDADLWTKQIIEAFSLRKRYEKFDYPEVNSWDNLFKKMISKL